MSSERRYSEQEVRAILERALRHEQSDGLSHSDLLEAAGEAGISSDAVERAALEVEGVRERELARERILARRRTGFFSHLWAFIGVQTFLVLLNLITSAEHLWFVYPLLGWGLGLFLAARAGLSKEVSERALTRELTRASFTSRVHHAARARLATPGARSRIEPSEGADEQAASSHVPRRERK